MKFFVIGITDAPRPYFPPEVLEIIKQGQLFSGGKRHHELVAGFLPDGAQWIDITVPLDAVFEKYQNNNDVVVFASGDPLANFGSSPCDALSRHAHRVAHWPSLARI